MQGFFISKIFPRLLSVSHINHKWTKKLLPLYLHLTDCIVKITVKTIINVTHRTAYSRFNWNSYKTVCFLTIIKIWCLSYAVQQRQHQIFSFMIILLHTRHVSRTSNFNFTSPCLCRSYLCLEFVFSFRK